MEKLTEKLICRRTRYITKGEIKHIKSRLMPEYFQEVLRIEKLAPNTYTIRFKKNATIEDYNAIKQTVERMGYKIYTRNKPYKQIRAEQKEIALEKAKSYLKENIKTIKSIDSKVNAHIEEAMKVYRA